MATDIITVVSTVIIDCKGLYVSLQIFLEKLRNKGDNDFKFKHSLVRKIFTSTCICQNQL